MWVLKPLPVIVSVEQVFRKLRFAKRRRRPISGNGNIFWPGSPKNTIDSSAFAL